MPIFSRRTIQRIIDENTVFLSPSQTQHHVDALNRGDQETVDFEWEVVMLNVFSKIGKVEHEPNFGGSSRVDLYFRHENIPQIEFIADIATVSDRGIEKENRREDFDKELNRLIRKHRLSPGCFAWHIDGTVQGDYNNGRMRLKIPQQVNWPEIFNDDFQQFMQEIGKDPNNVRCFSRNTDEISYSISYNPSERYQTVHYPSYKVAYSITKNPVYNTLKRKVSQLKKANYNGAKGIILCDGDCSLLKDTARNAMNFNLDQVIYSFLQDNSSIAFVLTFATDEVQSIWRSQGKRQFRINSRPYLNPSYDKAETQKILEAIQLLPTFLPMNITTAMNAQRQNKQKGSSFVGGFTVTENKIKMSSRALLDLLSGNMDPEKFFEMHGNFSPSGRAINLFKLRSKEGRLFENVTIEKCQERDDDWIVFEFGDSDPAISPFRSSK